MRRALSASAAFLSTALLAFCVWAYTTQPDEFASVTVWPRWVWAFPGLLLASPASVRAARRGFLLVLIAWIAHLAAFTEEPRSLVRGLWPVPKPAGQVLKVATINCSVGLVEPALETARFRPDVVLLQESPQKEDVARIARRLYGPHGGYAYGLDCSIVSRTMLTALDWGFAAPSATAATTRIGDVDVLLVSARLAPAPFREDIWSADSRRAYSTIRKLHRSQLREIAGQIRRSGRGMPVIVGGDFNSPPDCGAFREWEGQLHDSFRTAGRGWGNTFVNELPAIRIDQIWTSRNVRPLSVRAFASRHSDHRMVVATVDIQRLEAVNLTDGQTGESALAHKH